MPPHESCCADLENKPKKKRKEILAKHTDQYTGKESAERHVKKCKKFESRPVSHEGPNVKKGDHLRWTGAGISYYHHALCIDVDGEDGENITVLEYTGPVSGSSEASQSASGLDLGRLGKVKKTIFTYSQLIEKKAEVIVWPPCLRRFTPEETINRGERRLGENSYSIIHNNCEHFVTWCLCGVSVSLQVKSWYVAIIEILRSLITSKTVALVAANVADEAIQKYGRKLVPWLDAAIEAGIAGYELYKVYQRYKEEKYSSKWDVVKDIFWILAKGSLRFGLVFVGINYGQEIINSLWGWLAPYLTSASKSVYDCISSNPDKAGGLIEVGIAVNELKKAWDQWQNGVIGNKRELAEKAFEILAKGSLRFGLGYYGSKYSDKIFAGENPYLSKLNQSLVCGAAGGCLGHLAGVILTWIVENIEYITNSG